VSLKTLWNRIYVQRVYYYIYVVIIIHRADGRGAQSPRGGNITTETEKGFAFPPLIRDNITCVFLINMRAGRSRLNILYYYYTLTRSLTLFLTLSLSLSLSLYANSRRIIIIIFAHTFICNVKFFLQLLFACLFSRWLFIALTNDHFDAH